MHSRKLFPCLPSACCSRCWLLSRADDTVHDFSKTAVCHICSWWNGEQKCGRHKRRVWARQAGAGWAKGTVLKSGLKIDTHTHSSTLCIQPHKTRPACPIMESAYGRHFLHPTWAEDNLRVWRQEWREAGCAASSNCSFALKALV